MIIMSSPRLDLNQRPTVYKTVALPLSYKGKWVSSARHPQKALSAIFTALEGSDKRKHQTLFFLFSGRHPNGVRDLARVYTSKVCPAFSFTNGGDQIPDLTKVRI